MEGQMGGFRVNKADLLGKGIECGDDRADRGADVCW